MFTASSGQKENENDFQTNEHIKKNRPKNTNSYQASSARICHADKLLLSSQDLSGTASTSHIYFEHCAQRRARGKIRAQDYHHVENFRIF